EEIIVSNCCAVDGSSASGDRPVRPPSLHQWGCDPPAEVLRRLRRSSRALPADAKRVRFLRSPDTTVDPLGRPNIALHVVGSAPQDRRRFPSLRPPKAPPKAP